MAFIDEFLSRSVTEYINLHFHHKRDRYIQIENHRKICSVLLQFMFEYKDSYTVTVK